MRKMITHLKRLRRKTADSRDAEILVLKALLPYTPKKPKQENAESSGRSAVMEINSDSEYGDETDTDSDVKPWPEIPYTSTLSMMVNGFQAIGFVITSAALEEKWG